MHTVGTELIFVQVEFSAVLIAKGALKLTDRSTNTFFHDGHQVTRQSLESDDLNPVTSITDKEAVTS